MASTLLMPAARARPASSFPGQFKLGNQMTKPFVNAEQIKDHLALLNAFAGLKTKVEGMTDPRIAFLPSDPERRWAWFIGLAVERWDVLRHLVQIRIGDADVARSSADSRNGAQRCGRSMLRKVWRYRRWTC